ncbi:MAG: tetratricopeptide repeat protein [Myxococcaceae bacterium]|nr:tetratricopeptide repeat protein [Myxococcaceae bacterium]
MLLLCALGGGGYYGYLQGWLPLNALKEGNPTEESGATGATSATGPVAASGSVAPSGPAAATGSAVVPPPAVAVTPDAGAQPVAETPAHAGAPVAANTASPNDAGMPVAVNTASAHDAGTLPEPPVDAGAAAEVVKEEHEVTRPASTHAPRRLDFDALIAQGDRLRERERLEAALDAYGKAADLAPTRAEPYAGRGLVLLDMGQRSQAEAAFRQALKLNPRYAVAVMGLAETYRAMGRKEDAIKYYQQYLDILPNGPEAAVAKSAIQRLKE